MRIALVLFALLLSHPSAARSAEDDPELAPARKEIRELLVAGLGARALEAIEPLIAAHPSDSGLHALGIITLNHGARKSVAGARILVLGVAYKSDISDWRESPAVKVIALLQNAGANVAYHDPHVPSFATDGIALESVPLAPAEYDAVVIATAHSGVDYAQLVDEAELVVDLRNATGRAGITSEKIWKL